MCLGTPNRFHVLQRQGQRGLARGGGEGDQERLAHCPVKPASGMRADRRSPRPAPAPRTTASVAYMVRISLPRSEQHADALAAHGDGDSGAHAQRRQVHHVPRVAEHDLGQRLAERHHGLALAPRPRRRRRTGRQKTTTCRTSSRAIASMMLVGNVVLEHLCKGGRRRGRDLRRGRVRGDSHAFSRADQVDAGQAR